MKNKQTHKYKIPIPDLDMQVGRALEVDNHSVLISEKAPGFIVREKIR